MTVRELIIALLHQPQSADVAITIKDEWPTLRTLRIAPDHLIRPLDGTITVMLECEVER